MNPTPNSFLQISQIKDFSELKLPESISRALTSMNFKIPTPIQAQATPLALAGNDIIGCAQTGTGKTAAFCIPTLNLLLNDPQAIALILAPTREIAQQIEVVCRALTKFCPELRSTLIIGGVSMQPQLSALARHPRIIVGTPGRILDHMQRNTLQLAKVKMLVLDEADRILDMGFAPQLNKILAQLPTQRQTQLFTATWGSEMENLSKRYLRNPSRISAGKTSQAASTVKQSVIATTSLKKNAHLLDELKQRQGSVLVFARTKSRTDRLAKYLEASGMAVNRIHGGRSQLQRNAALATFKSGKIRVLVATDIAARGIDVAEIAHVINYDLPMTPADYIHRIGRTGRAGFSGNALSLLVPEEHSQWNQIVKLLKGSSSQVPQIQKS